jgi:pimeloyl-ACP methyl ester carboxylesterase
VAGEPIDFLTADGVLLRGLVEGGGPSLVVLVHDEGRDLDAHGTLVGELIAADIGVLRFDLRGHGLSEGVWSPDQAPLDVAAAVELAEARGAADVFVVAVGSGAAAALVAPIHARAMVLVSPPGVPPGRDENEARESTVAKLLLVGALDERAEGSAARLQSLLIGPRLLVHLPTAEQGHALYEGECRLQALSQTIGFLAQHRTVAPVA